MRTHETVLAVLDERTGGDLPPVITRLDLVGRAARRLGGDPVAASECVDDLLRDDSQAGQQLVAMERDCETYLCRHDAEAIAAANAWLDGGGGGG